MEEGGKGRRRRHRKTPDTLNTYSSVSFFSFFSFFIRKSTIDNRKSALLRQIEHGVVRATMMHMSPRLPVLFFLLCLSTLSATAQYIGPPSCRIRLSLVGPDARPVSRERIRVTEPREVWWTVRQEEMGGV